MFVPRDADRSEREAWLDAALMVASASGALMLAEKDALAYSMLEGEPLAGLTWDEIEQRRASLDAEAPLFPRARDALAALPQDRAESLLTFAARIASADAPLNENELSVLALLAADQGLTTALPAILAGAKASPGFARLDFNDPGQASAAGLFEHLAATREPSIIRRLLFKLHAVRALLDERFPEAKVTEVGEFVYLGPHKLRVDAMLEVEERRWLVRCLSSGEALHPREHELIAAMAPQLDEFTGLIIAHGGALSPLDAALLRRLPAPVRVEGLSVPLAEPA